MRKNEKLLAPVQLSAADRLDACVRDLRNILAEMHADAEIRVTREYFIDGSAEFYIFRVQFPCASGRAV